MQSKKLLRVVDTDVRFVGYMKEFRYSITKLENKKGYEYSVVESETNEEVKVDTITADNMEDAINKIIPGL